VNEVFILYLLITWERRKNKKERKRASWILPHREYACLSLPLNSWQWIKMEEGCCTVKLHCQRTLLQSGLHCC